MTTHLEPFFLANILLYVEDSHAIKAFPLVSKSCQTAVLTLKVNPSHFCDSAHDILTFFPNLNTLVIKDLSQLDSVDTIPNTITSIVIKMIDFSKVTQSGLRFADRVVEVQGCCSCYERWDFSLFPRLARLSTYPRGFLTLPTHTLKHLKLHCTLNNDDPFRLFPPECAELVTCVFDSLLDFWTVKNECPPPNVRLFCNHIGRGITPEEVRFTSMAQGEMSLSKGFDVDALRAFNALFLIPFRDASLWLTVHRPAYDVSFLTRITSFTVCLHRNDLRECALALPTSVRKLNFFNARRLSLTNTENITSLRLQDAHMALTPCPRLLDLNWQGATFPTERVPVCDIAALSALSLWVETVQPDFVFPPGLTSLFLHIEDKAFDCARLTHLTRLQRLNVTVKGRSVLDLSGMTALTKLDAHSSPTANLPVSLVEYRANFRAPCDLSRLTALTALDVSAKKVCLTFPTSLKALKISRGESLTSNIAETPLEAFDAQYSSLALTRKLLETFPKTLRKLKGRIEPESLKDVLPELFPLFDPRSLYSP